jgi:RimJ/RimL family protein N-acetyltransferase
MTDNQSQKRPSEKFLRKYLGGLYFFVVINWLYCEPGFEFKPCYTCFMKIEGENLYLKEGLAEENYPMLLEWFRDIELMGYISFVRQALELKNISELKSLIAEVESGPIFEVYSKEDKFIGYTSLSDLKENKECEFSVFILDKNYWKKGMGLEATKLTLNYAFNDLGMEKIILETSEFHTKAIRLYEKAGFRKTRLIPNDRTIFHDGKWVLSGTVEMAIEK